MGCETQLAWKCLFTPILFRRAILTRNVGHDLPILSHTMRIHFRGLYIQDYKCLCSAVTICATIVARKFHVYILTPVTPENRSNRGSIYQLLHHVMCTCDANFVTLGQ